MTYTPRLFTVLGSFVAKRRKKKDKKRIAKARALYEMMRIDNPDLPTWDEALSQRKIKTDG